MFRFVLQTDRSLHPETILVKESKFCDLLMLLKHLLDAKARAPELLSNNSDQEKRYVRYFCDKFLQLEINVALRSAKQSFYISQRFWEVNHDDKSLLDTPPFIYSARFERINTTISPRLNT